MWWLWQHTDRGRISEYAGAARHGSLERAALEDRLPMGTLAEEAAASDVINTEAGPLCYRY